MRSCVMRHTQIQGDRIGWNASLKKGAFKDSESVSIRMAAGAGERLSPAQSDEQWTKALKFALCNMKWLLTWSSRKF